MLLIKRFKLIWFVIYTLLYVPILLKFPYNKFSNKRYNINFFYIPERLLTKILLIYNKLIEHPNV